jgi:hypothetical protein
MRSTDPPSSSDQEEVKEDIEAHTTRSRILPSRTETSKEEDGYPPPPQLSLMTSVVSHVHDYIHHMYVLQVVVLVGGRVSAVDGEVSKRVVRHHFPFILLVCLIAGMAALSST